MHRVVVSKISGTRYSESSRVEDEGPLLPVPTCSTPCACAPERCKNQVIFKERWRQKEARLRRASLLGQAREWRLLPVIGEETNVYH